MLLLLELGVILHGIWQWCIVMLSPFICVIYILLYVSCCCSDEKADKISNYTIVPLIYSICVVIFLGCIGFVVLFVGNMGYWNDATFVDIASIDAGAGYIDEPMIAMQIIIAFGLIIFLVPVFACSLLLIAGFLDRERTLPNGMDSLKRSVNKLPFVATPRKKTKKGSDYDEVPMSAYPDPNYDVYN